jgi:hypothetical protein
MEITVALMFLGNGIQVFQYYYNTSLAPGKTKHPNKIMIRGTLMGLITNTNPLLNNLSTYYHRVIGLITGDICLMAMMWITLGKQIFSIFLQ